MSFFYFSWLYEIYVLFVEHVMYRGVIRVYIIHLVRCIILEDKSHVYNDVRCISLLTEIVVLWMGMRVCCCNDSLICPQKSQCIYDKKICQLYGPLSCLCYLYFFASINVNYVVFNCIFYHSIGSTSTFTPSDITMIG